MNAARSRPRDVPAQDDRLAPAIVGEASFTVTVSPLAMQHLANPEPVPPARPNPCWAGLYGVPAYQEIEFLARPAGPLV